VAGFVRLSSLADLPPHLRGACVAIGNFDGLHRGHQSIVRALRVKADADGVPALLLTFEPHPRDVFAPSPFMFRLTHGDAKARLAQAMGLDGIIVLPFDRAFSQNEAEVFVETMLVEQLGVRSVIVGADFHFGKGRAGTPDFLMAQGEQHGFSVEICAMLDDGTETVSSSRVRDALTTGDVETANSLLGYHHFFSGTVIEGDKRGRELGYPTANMAVPQTFGLAQGIYAVKIRLDGQLFDGVAAYGKPMFDNSRPPFETFIFDFDRTIYGKTLEIALLGFIRGQMTFDGLTPLIEQMDKDSAKARIITAQARPLSELDAALGFVDGTIG